MAGNALIGSLAVELGMDASEFARGNTEAQRELAKLQKYFADFDNRIRDVGKGLTKGITLPIGGMVAAVAKVGGDFEAAMGKVAISTQAGAAELEEMARLATRLGEDSMFGATEAADAMDMLAKNGLTATQVLNGAAKAAVDLAAAAGSRLEPAADAITDVMQQFGLAVGDLPQVVNLITGAVNASKLSFDDYQQAIAQAGGVAGGLGVTFEDLNVALAATSALFSSGSDAGTSFKTFLQRMVPASKDAADAMAEYGLTFFDAEGRMKPLAAVAQMLREKLAGLSDEAKNDVMTRIFGADALRTAIALMGQGGDGIERIRASLQATDAAAQAAQRMSGFNAQMEQLGGAFESLGIAIAKTGLLAALTTIVSKVADFVSWIAQANPTLLKIVVGFAAVSAAIGPLVIAIGVMAGTLLPLFLARLSPIGIAISAFINPIGTAVAALGRLALSMGGFGALLKLALPLLARFLGPLGLVVTAFQLWGDDVLPVLAQLKDQLVATLGPSVQALFAAIRDAAAAIAEAFAPLMSGPFGQAIGWLIDRIGELLAALLSIGGKAVIDVLNGAVIVITTAFKAIAGLARALGALLRGDFSGAWQALKATVVTVAEGLLAAWRALPPGIIGLMGQLVAGVRAWLVGKLGAVFDWVKGKLKAVGDWFFELYDRVVGNSYVPDMVDEVGQHMGRLDANLVQPAQAATAKAAAAFQGLSDRVRGLMEDLFPERAALAKFQADVAALEGDKGLSVEDRAEALRRLHKRHVDEQLGRADITVIGEKPLIDDAEVDRSLDDFAEAMKDKLVLPTRAGTAEVIDRFNQMAQGVLSALDGLVGSIKRGDIVGIIGGVLGTLGQIAGAVGGFNIGPLNFPGGGGGFGGGGFGGFDPGGPLSFGRLGAAGGTAARPIFDLRGAVMTTDLLDQMNRIGDTSARSGASMALSTLASQRRTALGLG